MRHVPWTATVAAGVVLLASVPTEATARAAAPAKPDAPAKPAPAKPDASAPDSPAKAAPAKPPAKPDASAPDDAEDLDDPPAPTVDRGSTSSSGGRMSAFDLPPADRDDPYGPRPAGLPVLTLDQIERYALGNPQVRMAEAQIEAMQARVRKAKFAWVPIIDTTMTLSPGVNIVCDDVAIETADPDAPLQDFQFCRPGGDPDLDVQTAAGYFRQLGRAGVRFSFQLDTVIPLYTFGKLKNVRKLAEAGLALTKLQKAAIAQETALRVRQAHTALLLSRASIAILHEANKIVASARRRVDEDLGPEDDFDADPDAKLDLSRSPDDRIRVRLAELELEELLREALKIESLALSGLWALAGTSAPRGFDVAAEALVPVELDGGRKTLAEYKKLAVTHRPEARMAAAAVGLKQVQERLARSNFLPDLGIALSVGVGRTNAADPQMSALFYVDGYNYSRVNAALALRWRFDFHNDAFDLQAARAELRAADHQRDAARLLLGREVEEAFADLVDAETTEEIRRAAAAEAWKLVVSQQISDSGTGGSSTELLRALEKWYRLRFSQVEAAGQHNLAAARLTRAVGTPLYATPTPSAPARDTDAANSGRTSGKAALDSEGR